MGTRPEFYLPLAACAGGGSNSGLPNLARKRLIPLKIRL